MTKRQRLWHALAPWSTSVAMIILTTSAASAQTSPTPVPTPTPTPAPVPAPAPVPTPATVVTDAVNVPVQIRASVLGIPVVNTQQIAHKSSLDSKDPTEASLQTIAPPGSPSAFRLLNNLSLDAVGLRVDLQAAAWAKTPGEPDAITGATTSTSSTSGSSSNSSSKTGATGAGAGQVETPADSLAHAALNGTAEAVVRLGPLNTEIVSISGRDLASTADVAGSCGSLTQTSTVSLGTTNLRILGQDVALPANPAPNTEVPLSGIPGLVGGTLVLNEQTTSGDGSTTQIVAVAPLRLQLRLSLAGLGGLADVDLSLAGNSAAVNCSPTEPAAPTTPPTTPTTPTTPTNPTTPKTPTTPTTEPPSTTPATPQQPTTPLTSPTAGGSSSPTPPSH